LALTSTAATAAAMFAATNIDDAVVLSALNASSRATGTPRRRHIWLGQYLGIGLMVALALLAGNGLRFVPLRWVGLLGLIPLSRGIAMLAASTIGAFRGNRTPPPPAASRLWEVTVLTFANGGDNIAVYTAAFRTMGAADTAVSIAVFAVGTALWCLTMSLLVSHPRVTDLLERGSRWAIPVVFVALGAFVFWRSGLLE
jgi:cadmium resistance protein CadD (predicted permease)